SSCARAAVFWPRDPIHSSDVPGEGSFARSSVEGRPWWGGRTTLARFRGRLRRRGGRSASRRLLWHGEQQEVNSALPAQHEGARQMFGEARSRVRQNAGAQGAPCPAFLANAATTRSLPI